MAKQPNQKLKILYILQLLQKKSDENHPISVAAILEELERYDISAERKSIYSDIEQLRQFGFDIEMNHSRTSGGYYLASRDFELAELKILVDSIQASKFITTNKTRALIKKLSNLCSDDQAKQLKHEVHVMDRVKTGNENIFYNVDAINEALIKKVMIRFSYFSWNEKGEFVLKNSKQKYEVTPLGLTFQNENYYLIAYHHDKKEKRHYRVDKMKNIEVTSINKISSDEIGEFDLVKYSNENFGMYAGEVETVHLKLKKSLIGIVIDRFGTDISIRELDEEYCDVRVTVAISGQFFGWLAGIGENICIFSPDKIRNQYIDYLNEIIEKHK